MNLLFPTLFAIVLGATNAFGHTCSCGGNSFTSNDITATVSAATSSHGHYPHAFNNREKLALPWCQGPYMEYPLTHPAPYHTGPPGPDRVVYQTKGGAFCGCITHTGAKGNNFVLCTNH